MPKDGEARTCSRKTEEEEELDVQDEPHACMKMIL